MVVGNQRWWTRRRRKGETLKQIFFFKLWLYLGSRKFWPRKKTTWSSFYIDPKKTIIISNYAVTKKSFFLFTRQNQKPSKLSFQPSIHSSIHFVFISFYQRMSEWQLQMVCLLYTCCLCFGSFPNNTRTYRQKKWTMATNNFLDKWAIIIVFKLTEQPTNQPTNKLTNRKIV